MTLAIYFDNGLVIAGPFDVAACVPGNYLHSQVRFGTQHQVLVTLFNTNLRNRSAAAGGAIVLIRDKQGRDLDIRLAQVCGRTGFQVDRHQVAVIILCGTPAINPVHGIRVVIIGHRLDHHRIAARGSN